MGVQSRGGGVDVCEVKVKMQDGLSSFSKAPTVYQCQHVVTACDFKLRASVKEPHAVGALFLSQP